MIGDPNLPEADEVLLEDLMLYLMARRARDTGAELRIPIHKVHEAFGKLEKELHALGVMAVFRRNPLQAYSKQVDEALNHLGPFAIQIENPRFSIVVRPEIADSRVTMAEKALPQSRMAEINQIYTHFSDVVAAP